MTADIKRFAPYLAAAAAVLAGAAYMSLGGLWNAPPAGDGVGYHTLAVSLLEGRGLEYLGYRSLRLPGYPALIAAVYAISAPSPVYLQLAQLLINAAACVLLYRTARLKFDKKTSLLAAFIFALSYDSFIMPSQVLSECLFSFLVIGMVYAGALAALKERTACFYAAEGLLAGAAYMVRQEAALLLAAILFFRWYFARHSFRPAALLLPLLSLSLALVVWGARNAGVHGRFFVGSTQSYNHLLAANFSVFNHLGVDFSAIGLDGDQLELVGGETDEFRREERRRVWTREMFAMVPATMLVKAFFFKIGSFLYPFLPGYDLTYMLALPFIFFGLYANRVSFRELYPFYAFLAMLAVVILIVHGIPRYRSPVTHLFSLFAASGFFLAAEKFGAGRTRAFAAAWGLANLAVFWWSEPLRFLLKRAVFG